MAVNPVLDLIKGRFAARSQVPMRIASGIWVPSAHPTAKGHAQHLTAPSQLRLKAVRAVRKLSAVPEFPASVSAI